MNGVAGRVVYPLVATGGSQERNTATGAVGYEGDADAALRALYDAHGSTLLSYLMRLTKGDRHRAEDLLQETLLRAHADAGVHAVVDRRRP